MNLKIINNAQKKEGIKISNAKFKSFYFSSGKKKCPHFGQMQLIFLRILLDLCPLIWEQ